MQNIPLLVVLSFAACKSGSTTAPAPEVPAAPDPAVAARAALSASIASAMKPTVDPCVDFYEYACGGWIEANPLPADKSIMTRSFTTIFDRNEAVIRSILEDAAANPGDDPVKQKLGADFGACMDTEAIEALGTDPVKPWLEKIDAVTDASSALKVAGELTDFGPNPFLGLGVWADDKQPDTNILNFSQSGLGLPDKSYYLELDEKEQERLDAYLAHMATMFVLFGDEQELAHKRAHRVLDFELKLAKTHWDRADLRDSEKTYNKTARADLAKTGVDFEAYFEGAGLPEFDSVNIRTPSAMKGLGALLKKSKKETLQDYLRWHIIDWSAPYLTAEIDKANFAFGSMISGQKEQRPRWKRCVARTDGAMGEWLGKAYVDARFAGGSKATAEAMVDGIFTAFNNNLPSLTWMDDATRERALEKSAAFVAKLGYPKKYRDYAGLEIDPKGHYANVVASGWFTTAHYESKIGQKVDKDEWHMTPQTVNAYYNPSQNEIVFPAGIMQAPFFDQGFPKSMNYGSLGMVIGHEITHGFDDEGRKYAPTGELKEWWEPEASERFEEVAQCVTDQYSSFEVLDGVNVQGELTLGENIADLGGLKVSHQAYKSWVEANGAEPDLAGLSGEKQFFVAFAQGWCTVATDEMLKLRIATDSHSPARFRVNGPAANYPGFAEAFECESGQPMAPEDVCEVW